MDSDTTNKLLRVLMILLLLWGSIFFGTVIKNIFTIEEKTTTVVLEQYVIFEKTNYLLRFRNLTDNSNMYIIVDNCCPCNFKNKINKKVIFKENDINQLQKLICK